MNSAASLPSSAATRPSSSLTEGSSRKTSSPTSAACMAARIPGVGRVTVSLRKSIGVSAFILLLCRGLVLVLEEPAPVLFDQADADALEAPQRHDGGVLARGEGPLPQEAA